MILILIGLFVTLVLDFAALHDIHKEYLSKNILETLEVQLSKEVPTWTENKGEWDYLNLSLLMKALSFSALFAIAISFYRKEKQNKS